MENLEEINRICYEIFSFCYDEVKFGLYESILFNREKEQIDILNKQIENLISANLGNEFLYQENANSYYIQLYAVHFLEKKLNDKQFLEILEILLLKENNSENFLSPLVLVLMSERKLPEDILRKIYKKIMIQQHFQNNRLGSLPYDYRYHLLKREELPKELVGELLTTYDDINLEELYELIERVMNELNSELRIHKIKNIQQIESIPTLKMEHHYFKIMKQYWNNRNKNEKIV